MVFYKRRHGADLHGVGVIGGVLEESVVRVEELLRQKEEELSRRTTVVQAAKEAEAREAYYVREAGDLSLCRGWLALSESVLGKQRAASALYSGSQGTYNLL